MQKKRGLILDFKVNSDPEDQKCRLPNNNRIAISEFDSNCVDSIECPGQEIKAYLVRKGEKLYLEPTNLVDIYYNRRKIDFGIVVSSSLFRLN